MQDGVYRALEIERLTDVVLNGLEGLVAAEVSKVLCHAGHQVIDADDRPSVGQQALGEVRSKEACPACDDRSQLRAADAAVDEAAIAHGLGVEDVAAVDDHGTAHETFDAVEVELPKLVPLGHDQ